MVPVGGGGVLFLPAFFAGFLAAFLTGFAAFLVATKAISLLDYSNYQDILNRLQYQLSSRTRRASIFRRRSAMSLAASKVNASPKPG